MGYNNSIKSTYSWGILDLMLIYILGWIATFIATFLATFFLMLIMDRNLAQRIITSLSYIIFFLILIAFIYIDIEKIHRKSFIKSLAFTKPFRKDVLFATFFMSVLAVYTLFRSQQITPTPALIAVYSDPLLFNSMMIFSITLSPLLEEMIFRGYVYSVFNKYGVLSAIFASAGLSLIFHLNKVWNNPVSMILTFSVFFVLGFIRARSKSVILCMGAHFYYNLFLIIGGWMLGKY